MRRTPRSHTETRGNRMCVSGFRPVGLARAIRNYNRCPESHGPSKPLPMAVDGRGKVAGQGTVKSAVAELPMSALGQKQTSRQLQPMSALPPIADIGTQPSDFRFVPKADIPRCSEDRRYSITWSARPSSGQGWC